MNWRTVVLFLAVVPFSVALAAVGDRLALRESLPTPGQVAFRLLPQQPSKGCCDLMPLTVVALVDTISWLVVLTALYALIRGGKTLLLAAAAPLSCVLALVCNGLASQHLVFTPGTWVWGLLHQRGFSDNYRIALGLSILADTICWLALLVAAYQIVRKFREVQRRPRQS